MWKFLIKILTAEATIKLLIELLQALAKKTDNEIDDRILEWIKDTVIADGVLTEMRVSQIYEERLKAPKSTGKTII